jgi:hypothetical protein
MAAFVKACAPASVFATEIRPNGLRATRRPFPALQDGAVPERAVFIGVAMWPEVDRNRQNIATRIESRPVPVSLARCSRTLRSMVSKSVMKIDSPYGVLFTRRKPSVTPALAQVQHHRLIGFALALVPTDAHRKFHVHSGVIAAGSIDRARCQFFEPLMKSRRVIHRSIPSSPSRESCTILFPFIG